jgi:hypothetical protein
MRGNGTAARGAKRSVAAGRTSMLAFIEMGAGYVRVSGEVAGELNRSAKTNCPRDDQCSRSCANAQTGVGEASGPALPAFASGKRGRESFGGPFGLTGTLRLVLLTLF